MSRTRRYLCVCQSIVQWRDIALAVFVHSNCNRLAIASDECCVVDTHDGLCVVQIRIQNRDITLADLIPSKSSDRAVVSKQYCVFHG